MHLIIVFILFTILIMTVYMFLEAKKLTIKNDVIDWPISMKNTKILFITDLHKREIKPGMLSKVPAVDYVIIGGDLCEKGVKKATLDNNLSKLTAFGKTLFIWGNNDYEYGEDKLTESLNKHGITTLQNQSLQIKEENHTWTIAGVDDLGCDRTNVELALKKAEGPVLLVSHNPEVAYLINDKYKDVQVIITGHTHGGQIRLGSLSLGERGGWTIKNNFRVFISNGFGTTSIPARFGAIPEIHVITIKGVNNQ
ncbi:metallophosphoesterase [Salipaludibacillus sp. HK11]|uniref:metallophosphoesterase n=1 Tax=Salipaludibacillus sp. HK11 TaxID=3394320 RepID=UPI0039FDC009